MKLSAVSHAILGIVAESDCSTYEIVQALRTRFAPVLGGTERRYYDEPKRLEAAGLLSGTEDWVGDRPRIVWSITVDGRIELARWMGSASTDVPAVQHPDLARILLGQFDSKAQLVATLESIAASAKAWGAQVGVGDGEDGSNQFDDLVSVFLVGLARFTADWADDAAKTVLEWRSVTAPGTTAKAHVRDRLTDLRRGLERGDATHHRHAR